MIVDIAKVQLSDAVKQLYQAFISALNCCAKLVTVDVEIIKQTDKAFFRLMSARRVLNMSEYLFKRFVQVLVLCISGADVAEQFRR